MREKISRRQALSVISGSAVGGLAGCTSGDDSAPDTENTTTESTTVGSSTSGNIESVTLTVATGGTDDPKTHPYQVKNFKQIVEEESNGQITARVFTAGEQGSTQEVAQKVQQGSLDIVNGALGNLAPYAPKIQVNSMPFIVPTFDDAEKLYSSETYDEIVYENFRENGFEPMGRTVLLDLRHWGVNPGVTENGVRVPSDIEGLKFRTGASKVKQKAVREAGASPQNIEWTETPSAFKEGVIDGIHVSSFAFCGYELDWTEYVSSVGMNPIGLQMAMNKNRFDGLNKETKEVIQTAAQKTNEQHVKDRDSAKSDIITCIKDMGVNWITDDITDQDRQKWIDMMGPSNSMWDSIIEDEMPFTKEEIESLVSVVQ